MHWLQDVSGAKEQLDECIELEQVRYSVHFNVLLGQQKLSHLRVIKQLRRSRRAEQHDYFKGKDEIPCFGFVASKTADNPALTFLVSFERESDGTVYLWIQEFHP